MTALAIEDLAPIIQRLLTAPTDAEARRRLGVILGPTQAYVDAADTALAAAIASEASTRATADGLRALKAGDTFTGAVSVPDDAYDATAWNGNNQVPTKNAMRDKIESLSSGGASPVKWNHTDRGAISVTAGLLLATGAASGAWPGIRATKYLEGDGAWYWEWYINMGAANVMLGISPAVLNLASEFVGQLASGYAYYASGGQKYNNNAGAAYGASYTTADVIGCAFKVASGVGSLWFRKNGTWQNSGDPAAGTGAAFTAIPADAYFPTYSQNQASAVTLRALASSFSGSIPSGFVALGA